uniref:BPTI/Kunitz inhibitor domain-containing protein n=1 Tax=Nippostrongylus brasiliensis TaxID=27835 RepID=A0A0N4XK23_NIPBR
LLLPYIFVTLLFFSEEAPAEQCPIEAPLNFTYHTSGGSCSSRISSITRCSDWNRLSFRYQACPENPTKEASVIYCFVLFGTSRCPTDMLNRYTIPIPPDLPDLYDQSKDLGNDS